MRKTSMRNRNEPVYRHELKYLINEGEKEALKSRIGTLLALDGHAGEGGYMIRSLYFDDMWDSAYAEKNMGVMSRCKYRIRIYDCSDHVIRLERKKKVGSYICKESAPLTREETERLIDGEYDFLLGSDEPLCREFYIDCAARMMRPRVIVDYEREPFVMAHGTVRVTFDSHVRAALLSRDLFDPLLPSLEALAPGKVVMEVNLPEFLPKVEQELLPPRAAEFTALSKYVLCYERTRYLNGWGYWEEEGGAV